MNQALAYLLNVLNLGDIKFANGPFIISMLWLTVLGQDVIDIERVYMVQLEYIFG